MSTPNSYPSSLEAQYEDELARVEATAAEAEAEAREEAARYWAHVEALAEQQYRELAAAGKLEADVPEPELEPE